MRTISILTIAAIFAFSSCQKKSYTCVCTGGFAGTTEKTEIKAKNRGEAETKCKNMSTPPNVSDGYSCELK